jgi:hypothetical protein
VARAADFFSERTAWVRRLQTPLRQFLRTETGGAAVLLAAAVAALVWVNVDALSYEELWGTELSLALGGEGLELSLREWVNSGLMTFFFFVVGLETRREFDLGKLRERRRFCEPGTCTPGQSARRRQANGPIPRLHHGLRPAPRDPTPDSAEGTGPPRCTPGPRSVHIDLPER